MLELPYKERVPKYYSDLVDADDPECPIRRQAFYDPIEQRSEGSEFRADPLGDLEHRPAPHITHRYKSRVLFHVTSQCAMYCRYCFRKSLLNELADDFTEGLLSEGIGYIRENKSLREVIFSGGDPFVVNPRVLASLVQNFSDIPHLENLRFHTRVPVTDPDRVGDQLCSVLAGSRLPVVIVTHYNHPREITPRSSRSIERLLAAGCTLLNQSVLLKGVNDRIDILSELSRGLFHKMRILPYYLHHPDRARGTSHFWVDFGQGKAIYDGLRCELPGYLVPRYVVDTGDSAYKKLVHEIL